MSSEITMQAAFASENFGLNVKPSLLKNAFERSRSFTGRLTKILVDMLVSRVRFFPFAVISGEQFFELVERAGPTSFVPVARGLVEELFVDQCEERTRAVRLDQDRHERLALRRRAPRPGED